MKRFKNLLFIVLGFVVIFSLTGCGNKTAITAEDFKTKMEAKDYVIKDAKEQFSKYEFIEKVYLAQDSDEKYQLEFYEMSDADNAANFYIDNKQIFEDEKGSTSLESSVSVGNYSKYNLETNGKYKVVSRIDNTVIFLNVDVAYKSIVQEILKDLGY